MKLTHLRLIGVFLALIGFGLLGFNARKTITLIVDGEPQTLTTSAFKVADALKAAGLAVAPGDELHPNAEQWLKDGQVISLERAGQISITAGKSTRTLLSTERLPANLLALAGIALYPGDALFADGRPIDPDDPLAPAPAHSLQLRRAVCIELQAGAESRTFYSSAPTLGKALSDAGIQIYAADHLDPQAATPLPSAELEDGVLSMPVVLRRAQPLTVSYKDGQMQFRSAAQTVGEALAEAGLALQGLDYTQPSAESSLPSDGRIRLVRVQEVVQVEQEPLPFESELQPAQDLELDTRKILDPGEYGITARSMRIRYEDGEEISRTVEDEWIARQPKNRIVGYGTKIVVRTLDTPNGPIEYWRAVQMYATSYSPCRIFKDRCDDYTALGATLQKGIVAMTNYWCRTTCGDRVFVPGYGVGTVADTGGGIPGRYWIDLGYSDDDYVSWHQWVTVYFLTPVPSNIMWVLP